MGEAAEHHEPDAAPRSAEVGARVSAVLTAAEEAAAQIRREAQEEAERIVREAEERGRARVEELTGEPERLLAEAEADSRRRREETDRAIEEARALAQDEARRFDEDARRAQEELLSEVRAIEDERKKALSRLQRALGSLRTTSNQLEEICTAMSPNGEEPERRGLRALLPSRGDPNGHSVYESLQQRLAAKDAVVEESEQTTEVTPPAPKS